jgi:fructose-1,6-bisphosphatase I
MQTEPSLGGDLEDFLAAAPAEVARVVVAVASAATAIAALIRQGPLAGALGAAVGVNSDGDVQKALDLFADKTFEEALRGAGVRALASEERDDVALLDPGGEFLVALDPLDGSSNIDVNVAVASIFGVLDAPAAAGVRQADFLQPGRALRAAGLVVYGPHVSLLFTVGAGAHEATLDPQTGRFRMTRLNLFVPEGRAEFAINASNARHWPAPIRAYIDDCLMGETGPRQHDFNMRWIASMAADAYRVMQRGGVYLYPADARAGFANGRLHCLYEANPIAMLIEQAGGLATDGVNRILDLPFENLHARTPLVFGSTDKVERVKRYFLRGDHNAERSPLFGRRGLLRG